MDKIAMCPIFKDEVRYLLEWLAFHRLIGVDSFVLYDNGSTDGGPELIRRSPFAHHVTLIDWPGVGMQIPAYKNFCADHAAKFDWAAVIDLDEFIMPVGGNTIREPLTRRAYSNYSSILLQWFVFGPSGHRRRPNGLVIESYTTRLPDDFPSNRHVKPLVRGKAVATASTTPHIINVSGPTCNTRGETVLSYAQQPIECHDVLAINTITPSRVTSGWPRSAAARPTRRIQRLIHTRTRPITTSNGTRSWKTGTRCALFPD
jgi:hypothetical protein